MAPSIEDLTTPQESEVIEALEQDDEETAIEIVFSIFPELTRDEAVNIVEEVDVARKYRHRR